MHRALGTEWQGMVRFSFGWFNTPADVAAATQALAEIAARGSFAAARPPRGLRLWERSPSLKTDKPFWIKTDCQNPTKERNIWHVFT